MATPRVTIGGGLYVSTGGTVAIRDTIVATNRATTGPDVDGSFTSDGHNLIGKTDGSTGWIGSDLTGSIAHPLNPGLGSLGNYGGPTETIELLLSSPAVGAGTAVGGITTDERGVARPATGPDIGAFQIVTFTVTTSADSGAGSLRQAIEDADGSDTPVVITFSVGTVGSQQTITPATPLPGITVPILINGWSQGGTGYSSTPLVILDGASAGTGAVGLTLGTGSDGSIVNALVINSFNEAGISIASTQNTIVGSYIGTNAAGTAAGSQPMAYGVVVTGANNTIGGAIAGDRNVISGNTTDGVEISGTHATGNVVAADYIGTSVTGETAIGNGSTYVQSGDDDIDGGVLIILGASNNLVGTSGQEGSADAAERNVISGNYYTGIIVSGAGTSGNVVAGDYVGPTATGEAALGNGTYGDGVDIVNGASGNWIGVNSVYGAETPDQGNVISGNNPTYSLGIWTDPTSHGNVIAGNLIGVDAAGTASLPDNIGILLEGNSNLVGTTGQDGATDAAIERNVISGNEARGIDIDDAASDDVVAGNYIGTNAAGAAALPNGAGGILLDGAATGNWIGVNSVYGSANADQRNIISGNAGDGVELSGTGTTGNIVAGNYIGTDATGNVALGNADDGVEIDAGATANTIGAASASGIGPSYGGNLISANKASWGVYITGSGTSENLIEGNEIGTNLAGTSALPNADAGIWVTSPSNTIGGTAAGAGNLLSGNAGAGVVLAGAVSTLVEGNLIGTDVTGTSGLGNEAMGILIYAGGSANTIGGTSAAAHNVIADNGPNGFRAGIEIDSPDTLVEGNYIGTNQSGSAALANLGVGILVAAAGTTIGGVSAGAGNLVSGNNSGGISLYTSAPSTLIEGNKVGTNSSGTAALGNKGDGFDINSNANTIGGTAIGAGNLISGNLNNGLYILGSGATGNLIQGNEFGTNVAGTAALANGADGILNIASSNTVGGTAAGAGNLISGNAQDGIEISGSGSSANLVTGNNVGISGTGTSALGNTSGVAVDGGATNNTISGNVVSGNVYGAGAVGTGTSGNLFTDNLVGVVVTAGNTIPLPNSFGLLLQSGATNNTIGGSSLSAANVISGNSSAGIDIGNTGTSGNLVENNYIGTDAASDTGLGDVNGIVFYGDANGGPTHNTIGAGNVISGNSYVGIAIYNPGTSDNVVAGNLIGTNTQDTRRHSPMGSACSSPAARQPTRSAAVARVTRTSSPATRMTAWRSPERVRSATWWPATSSARTSGAPPRWATASACSSLEVHRATRSAAPRAATGDLISGNSSFGVEITGSGTSGNLVAGDYIGTNGAGTIALGNNSTGLLITGGASSNTIGGIAGSTGNLISGNSGDGMDITGSGTADNVVAGNLVGLNQSGTQAIGNAGDGIEVFEAATSNTIGSTASGAGNVVLRQRTRRHRYRRRWHRIQCRRWQFCRYECRRHHRPRQSRRGDPGAVRSGEQHDRRCGGCRSQPGLGQRPRWHRLLSDLVPATTWPWATGSG